jgi:glycosyltransferase involved in cell wall biosynthesis/SAM-dependent methyltransferase
MRKGLVSLHMPVLNGERFLPQLLDSLLAQDYKDFELIILDDGSTDRTPEICAEYARRDARIRYILDDRHRITHDANSYMATLFNGEFCVGASDDDLYQPAFLSTLVGALNARPDVGLAYCNAVHVDVDGNRGSRRLLKKRWLGAKTLSRFRNVWDFLVSRRNVPMLFGVYRTDAFKACLPWDTFDETIADVDTLFLVKFLARSKVYGVDEVLFLYRNKYRAFDPKAMEELPKDNSRVRMWLYRVRHQGRFFMKVLVALDETQFTSLERAMLKARALYAFLFHVSIAQTRPLVARILQSLGLREGVATRKDEHFDIRSEAHQRRNTRGLLANRGEEARRSLMETSARAIGARGRSRRAGVPGLVLRWVSVVLNVRGIVAVRHLPRYLNDLATFVRKSQTPVRFVDSYPCLAEATAETPFDGHYFFQAGWIARRLALARPRRHVDIGSEVGLVGVLSAFVETIFVDYRPLPVSLAGLECRKGDLLDLDWPPDSIESLSCLHVVEHVGLGRYGDAIDPEGSAKACSALARVLAPGGSLYLSAPVGRERVCFNAHRVFSPATVREMLPGLRLESFAYVDDEGRFHEGVSPEDARGGDYGCGMFHFVKPPAKR